MPPELIVILHGHFKIMIRSSYDIKENFCTLYTATLRFLVCRVP
jgi:hypothetical protein